MTSRVEGSGAILLGQSTYCAIGTHLRLRQIASTSVTGRKGHEHGSKCGKKSKCCKFPHCGSPNCGIAQLFDFAAPTSNDSENYNALHEAEVSALCFS